MRRQTPRITARALRKDAHEFWIFVTLILTRIGYISSDLVELSEANAEKWILITSLLSTDSQLLAPDYQPTLGADYKTAFEIRQRQKRLTCADVDKVVTAYVGGSTTYEIARQFGVHRYTVSQHLKGRGIKLGQRS
ncbi:helix-turn-helix domain-containing protein [Acidithrix ferrooxidans]|uniref:Uncharacterized protein n=1 Tax=Acidithrix ferrooxidans TaxID=1280514 RepID=A0A0D8HJK4_9ACTN|nr:hypothetical protein [Acidithrix ferrooxidans]KJF18044.1 hypothetical protein AXFE_11430 [Acidithrix ferrooxidans]